MFNMNISISIIGIIVFILPMLINIVYFVYPPDNQEVNQNNQYLELVEQSTRILYAITISCLTSKQLINYHSLLLYLAIIFLVLYYIVWFHYFIGGRDIRLLSKSFLFIPMPLAVFPVLYFIFSALWLKNYYAVIVMVIFGIVHYVNSTKAFK